MAERGDSGKIWASVLKEAIKRRKPDFNETWYGFRAFGNLLEEAQARGLLEFGRDEKSGAYVFRQGASPGRPERHERMDRPEQLPMVAAHAEPAGQADPVAAGPADDHQERREPRRRSRGGRHPASQPPADADLAPEPAAEPVAVVLPPPDVQAEPAPAGPKPRSRSRSPRKPAVKPEG